MVESMIFCITEVDVVFSFFWRGALYLELGTIIVLELGTIIVLELGTIIVLELGTIIVLELGTIIVLELGTIIVLELGFVTVLYKGHSHNEIKNGTLFLSQKKSSGRSF